MSLLHIQMTISIFLHVLIHIISNCLSLFFSTFSQYKIELESIPCLKMIDNVTDVTRFYSFSSPDNNNCYQYRLFSSFFFYDHVIHHIELFLVCTKTIANEVD